MSERMPFVIYVFALCAFALGFTEFVTIGLVSTISADLHTTVSQVGMAVTAYALGAVIGAPVLTALATRWPRKRLLLVAMAMFTLGNAVVSVSDALMPMLVARFASGLGHGVFLAVASSVATQLAGQHRAGAAVAVVFGGLTLALAIGVPVGTYLGSLLSWQVIFMGVAGSRSDGFDFQFHIIEAARYHAAIIIRERHNGLTDQIRTECRLAARVERVHNNQREHCGAECVLRK